MCGPLSPARDPLQPISSVAVMSVSPAGRSPQPKINPRFLPVIDRVLIAGLKLGPAGKHEAINKLLQLVPEWKRGDCWRRIRQLRRTSVLATLDATHDLKKADNNGSRHRPFAH